MPRFYPVVEIAPGANLANGPATWSWTDLTLGRYVHDPSKISITRGRQDRYAQTAPASCSLVLLNPSGIWVPDNPTGTYYGQIDQNTPLRVLNRANINSASDAFGRTVSSGWGTADSGGAWTNNGGSASDYSVGSGVGRHTHPTVLIAHYTRLSTSITRVDLKVRVRANALSTGGSQSAGLLCRYADTSNHARAELQFETSGAITARLVERIGGTDNVRASADTGLTHSTTTWYWVRLQTMTTEARVRVWQDGTSEPATWLIDGTSGALTVTTAGTLGCWSRRNSSNSNTDAQLDFDDYSMADGPYARFTGHVDAWPTTWADASENQSFAPITASGRLRIVSQAQNLKSAYYRVHTQAQWSDSLFPVGYWPMEDGSSATSFASGLSGGPVMSFTDWRPAADSDVPGSDPLPIAGGSAVFQAIVPTYDDSDEWTVHAVMRFPALPSTATGVIAWTTGGTVDKWVLILTGAATWTIQGYTNGTEVLGASSQNFIDTDGGSLLDRQIYMEADAIESGGNIGYSVYLWSDTDTSSALGVSGSVAGSIGNVTKVFCSAYPGYAASGGFTIGHVGVAGAFGWAANISKIVRGYATETAKARFERLCSEESIPYYFGEPSGAGAGSTGQLMGAQRTASLIQQLREVEATEEGILFDGLAGHVVLLPRRQRQNHAVNLTLDHDQYQLGWPFEPLLDDFLLRNDISAANVGGSTVRASDITSVRSRGVYSESITISVADDTEVVQHANWRLNAGKTPQRRYPSIVLNLHDSRMASLVDDWLACDIGSRIQLQNLLFTPDDADLLLEGYTETMDSSYWTVEFNTSPAQPWSVFQLEDSDLGRLDTTGSSLLCAYDSAATSLLVATANNKAQWSTTAEPYNWNVAGEKITVTTMNTNASAFVAAGTASHGDNATLSPSLPASVTKGDLLLVFCAIRNTSATITTPTGYTALLSDGNVALFGKIHSGSESAPSVAFSGGSAGDSTSAQMAAFRYTQNVVAYSNSSSNAAAANIAVPAMLPPQHNCVALWLGWKQDDWTSVATYAGTEIGEPSTTTGNDQGLVWDYQLQTTATETAAGSFVVTGGTNQISKGYVVLLAGDVQSCTVTRSINGVSKSQSAGTAVSLWRPGVWAL